MGDLKECLLHITALVVALAYAFMLIIIVLIGLVKFFEVMKWLL